MRTALLVLVSLLLTAMPTLAQGESKGSPSLKDGVESLGHAQSILEFFFMQTGVYPPALSDLDVLFNERRPTNTRAVKVPLDPASGKPFVYKPGENRKGYRLTFPDPTLYGLAADFSVGPVSWGWLALRAERNRFEKLALASKVDMEVLATQVEMYAKDNSGVYPPALDALYPKYIKRHPQDPITGKNYAYQILADGYLISSPNPERYGLRLFQYSSSRGMVVEPLSSDGR